MRQLIRIFPREFGSVFMPFWRELNSAFREAPRSYFSIYVGGYKRVRAYLSRRKASL